MNNNEIHEKWMKLALKEAKIAFSNKEVPIGAVIIKNDKIKKKDKLNR